MDAGAHFCIQPKCSRNLFRRKRYMERTEPNTPSSIGPRFGLISDIAKANQAPSLVLVNQFKLGVFGTSGSVSLPCRCFEVGECLRSV